MFLSLYFVMYINILGCICELRKKIIFYLFAMEYGQDQTSIVFLCQKMQPSLNKSTSAQLFWFWLNSLFLTSESELMQWKSQVHACLLSWHAVLPIYYTQSHIWASDTNYHLFFVRNITENYLEVGWLPDKYYTGR